MGDGCHRSKHYRHNGRAMNSYDSG
jgi:hypothetical protein